MIGVVPSSAEGEVRVVELARLLAEIADLREKVAALQTENMTLKSERDRLAASLNDIAPVMTELDLEQMERNVGTLDDIIRELESQAEVSRDGQ